jgi:hypothetical protein
MSGTEVTGKGLYFERVGTGISGNERTELFHGPSGPHWLRANPMPAFGLVCVGQKSFHTVNDGGHLLKLLLLR